MVPDFRHKDPDRTEINAQTVVLEDIIDAIAIDTNKHLARYEVTSLSSDCTVTIRMGLDKIIRYTELLKRRLRDHQMAENRRLRGG